jgi:hypothetical protein
MTTLKLRAGVFMVDTDYGIALLDEGSGRYWNLNPTGALVLRTLLGGGTAAQAADDLAEQYDVDLDSANRDVHTLVGDLQSARLVEP